MKKAIKRIAMLFMVCGLAVSVSFGDGYGNIDMLKEQIEKFEAYALKKGLNIADLDCEKNRIHRYSRYSNFYCEAKLGLLLLEEAKAKKIDYYSYDMGKFIWGDERFKDFRNWGYGGKLDIMFSGLKRDFKEYYEEQGLE